MNSRDDNRGLLEVIGVHPAVGYVDLGHLAPAIMGAMTFRFGNRVLLSANGQCWPKSLVFH